MTTHKIIDIPTKMEKFYGKGKMLHPSLELVELLIKRIPQGKISTIDLLAKKLANDFNVDITCPMRTGNIIKKLAKYFPIMEDSPTPYWRVIKKDEFLIKTGNLEDCAAQLEEEGFELFFKNEDKIKVNFGSNQLYTF